MPPNEDELIVVPELGRLLIADLRGLLLVAAVALALALGFGIAEPLTSVLIGLALGLATGLYRAIAHRKRYALKIDSHRIQGPCRGPAQTTAFAHNVIDWTRSGIRRGKLWLVPRHGEAIRADLAWYSAGQIERIRAALRDHTDPSELPESLRYAG